MMEASSHKREQEILRVAAKLFSSKGYNGTSVDQIAAKAKVNKATIYYYFPSKKAVLDRLINDFMDEMCNSIIEMLNSVSTKYYLDGLRVEDKLITFPDDRTKEGLIDFSTVYIPHMLDFFEKRRDILRIMFMESLKEGENRFLLFRFTDILHFNSDKLNNALSASSMEISSGQGLLITKFFGGILPIIFYAISSDAWIEHYETTRERLREELINMFRIMMAGYLYTHSAPLKQEDKETQHDK